MESFISKLKDNLYEDPKVNYKKSSRIREFLSYVVSASSDVKIIDNVGKDGDVEFEVDGKEIGLSHRVLKEYEFEVFSGFVANFIGELIVRENINEFARLVTGIDMEEYQNVVDEFEHRSFGMRIVRGRLLFKFHVSLLIGILTEDLERKIK